MDISIFTDKTKIPTNEELFLRLGTTRDLWQSIWGYVYEKYPSGKEEWNYPGKKYGWSFRRKDKRRAIVYFLPREGYFKVAFVFGKKAVEQILQSNISAEIKNEIKNARVYAEGRGIRIDVNDHKNLTDIKDLIMIKLAN